MNLLEAGINIHTLHGNKTYHREYHEMDLFQSILEMSRSQKESLWKSDRIASNWWKKQDAACLHGTPLGNSKPAWLDLVLDAQGNRIGFEPNGYIATIEVWSTAHRLMTVTKHQSPEQVEFNARTKLLTTAACSYSS